VVGVVRRDGRRLKNPGPREDRDIEQIESVVLAYAQEADQARREAEQALEASRAGDARALPAAAAGGTEPARGPRSGSGRDQRRAGAGSRAARCGAAGAAVALLVSGRRRSRPAAGGSSGQRREDGADAGTRSARGFLTSVRPEEFLVVAVDFTARGFPFRPERSTERTLVVKAKKRDLDERRSGKLAADELRKRIEVHEY
jgi:hypothetical protein